MAAEHRTRVVGNTEEGYIARCITCDWSSSDVRTGLMAHDMARVDGFEHEDDAAEEVSVDAE